MSNFVKCWECCSHYQTSVVVHQITDAEGLQPYFLLLGHNACARRPELTSFVSPILAHYNAQLVREAMNCLGWLNMWGV